MDRAATGPVAGAKLVASPQAWLRTFTADAHARVSGYGSDTATLWHAFRSALHRAACCHADWTLIGAGALAMFRCFEAAISADT